MGDRNNPIKFGPEWLRNLSRERNTGGNGGGGGGGGSASASGAPSTSGRAATPAGGASSSNNAASAAPRTVQFAKLRYGREEMLALYDWTGLAPAELRLIEIIYQPRGKPPFALINSFEEDVKETLRPGGMPMGGGSMVPTERFGAAPRSVGRAGVPDNRPRPRMPFVRQTSSTRGGWHNTPSNEENPPRPWAGTSSANVPARPGTVPAPESEWAPNKTFRSKRQGTNTNWRQAREEGEEWRASEAAGRSRPPQQDNKWGERDWGERSDKTQQPWAPNRRTWGGESQSEDTLPEWAVDNADPGTSGGTFDSSGAFHGYSNDDSNLPKNQQEPTYALTRSHTHGSFVRTKTAEEVSQEEAWWASEKAKKLSPKRFDASEIKFKKQPNTIFPDSNPSSTSTSKSSGSKDDTPEKEELSLEPQPQVEKKSQSTEPAESQEQFEQKDFKTPFQDNKGFKRMMRSEIEEPNDGSFQSVMINPNNSLRQKHQNIVSPIEPTGNTAKAQSGILHLIKGNNEHQQTQQQDSEQHQNRSQQPQTDIPKRKQQPTPEEKIVDVLMELRLKDKDILSKIVPGRLSPSMSSPALASVMSTAVSNSIPNAMPPSITMSSIMSMPSSVITISSSVMGSNVMSMPMSNMSNIPNKAISLNNLNLKSNKTSLPTSMQNQIATNLQGQTQAPQIQNVGITNSALNASLGLSLNHGHSNIRLPMQGLQQNVLSNQGINNMSNSGLSSSVLPGVGLQATTPTLPNYQSGILPGMSGQNVANSSLFMGQAGSNSSSGDMQSHSNRSDMFPRRLQSPTQQSFQSSLYNNILPHPPTTSQNNNMSDTWYYEDPNKIIQGPFSSADMYNWYRAGFFTPTLMVRRVCDTQMRPLGSYGPIVPFAQQDIMSYPMGGGFDHSSQREPLHNSQPTLGLDVINRQHMNLTDNPLDFGSVGLIRNQSFGQAPNMVDTLWGQPTHNQDLLWMQQTVNSRVTNENQVNNLPLYFWDQQPSAAIGSNALLPEDIAKEMKTEDQILAQIIPAKNKSAPNSTIQGIPFPPDVTLMPPPPPPPAEIPTDNMGPPPTLSLEELQKLIQAEMQVNLSDGVEGSGTDTQAKAEKLQIEQLEHESINKQQHIQQTKTTESKSSKQSKNEAEKVSKAKETNKSKKKNKEEKREASVESTKREEESSKTEQKKSEESSPAKTKKEDKANKKELEKEKKEWLKEGFIIVKGQEKVTSKDTKKKAEEAKVAEEAERKRKGDEKQAAEEEKRRKQAEALKKQQEIQQQQQLRQATESVMKKAPWSAVSNQSQQGINKEGSLTLSEIQRLEREKKLEQMKEQQHMMQMIAQQQQRQQQQELQASMGWAKKKAAPPAPSQSLAEIIQLESKAASQTALNVVEPEEPVPQPIINHVPWGLAQNGAGGFWDAPAPRNPKPTEKAPETQKPAEPSKTKKKVAVATSNKKESSPVTEFNSWCASILSSWNSKIDVPTFVGFLKDIESPFEVKDYVKYYLGETKDSSEFARQFLERRSKLLRVGMVTPSDDLCSPAIAVNPRAPPPNDYHELKNKSKQPKGKTKKNKMLKVDARILGFSVTAAEDRINVGDIDTV